MGRWYTVPSPAGLVARHWPIPRGQPADRYQRSIQDNLRHVTTWARSVNDREVDPLRQALHAWNGAHQGLRGSATIRLEDLMTQLGYGRLWGIALPNGRTVYSREAIHDVSRRLDWLEPQIGAILTRAPAGWLPTIPCEAGAICRQMHSIPAPGCCPPAQVTPSRV